MLDATSRNIPIQIRNIADVAVNGESLGLNAYPDIGLFDTMEDLFVNSVGALAFSPDRLFPDKERKREEDSRELYPAGGVADANECIGVIPAAA